MQSHDVRSSNTNLSVHATRTESKSFPTAHNAINNSSIFMRKRNTAKRNICINWTQILCAVAYGWRAENCLCAFSIFDSNQFLLVVSNPEKDDREASRSETNENCTVNVSNGTRRQPSDNNKKKRCAVNQLNWTKNQLQFDLGKYINTVLLANKMLCMFHFGERRCEATRSNSKCKI